MWNVVIQRIFVIGVVLEALTVIIATFDGTPDRMAKVVAWWITLGIHIALVFLLTSTARSLRETDAALERMKQWRRH